MIHRFEFSIDIRAGKTAIWKALWDDASYRDWASVFFEGSYAISEHWEEGSKVHFLGPDGNGIYSLIAEHRSGRIMRFRHIAAVKAGEEQTLDDESRSWSGATETYALIEIEDGYRLAIEIDVLEEHLEYMKSTFPKALERIKENSLS